MRRNQIYRICGTAYKEMTGSLLAASDLEGCIRSKMASTAGPNACLSEELVHQARICIKPNLVVPSPAELGATTHPEVVAGIIEYLQERHFQNVFIAEGSWVGDRTSEAFACCGYETLSKTYGVPLIDTQKEHSLDVEARGMTLRVTDVVDRMDFLINVPVLKGHCQTKMTCALKNLKGLIPNAEKRHFHTMGLHKPIAHLQTAILQDFVVVDHICGDQDFEEGGNPVVCNTLLAARDPVLTDAYACDVLGYAPEEVPYVKMAEALGVGSADLNAAEVVTIRLKGDGRASGAWEATLPEGEVPFKTEASQRRRRRVLDVSYAVEEVDSCSACYGSLVGALYRLKEEGLLDRLDVPIGIGQGMQGRTGKLGIGKCTREFEVCIMGCPPEEEQIYRELRAYVEAL